MFIAQYYSRATLVNREQTIIAQNGTSSFMTCTNRMEDNLRKHEKYNQRGLNLAISLYLMNKTC